MLFGFGLFFKFEELLDKRHAVINCLDLGHFRGGLVEDATGHQGYLPVELVEPVPHFKVSRGNGWELGEFGQQESFLELGFTYFEVLPVVRAALDGFGPPVKTFRAD